MTDFGNIKVILQMNEVEGWNLEIRKAMKRANILILQTCR